MRSRRDQHKEVENTGKGMESMESNPPGGREGWNLEQGGGIGPER